MSAGKSILDTRELSAGARKHEVCALRAHSRAALPKTLSRAYGGQGV